MTSYLVTGGEGLVGSNFVRFLLEKNSSTTVVVSLDRLCHGESPRKIDDDRRYSFYNTDINDASKVKEILERHQINTIVHLAMDKSCLNSPQFPKDIVFGTHNLLECCRMYGKIDRFIFFSSDQVYGDISGGGNARLEDACLNPTNPYAAAKVGAEFMVRSYAQSFKFPAIIVRANTIYGPFQFPDKVIPLFIQRLAKGEKCDIHGDGTSRRFFIHVQDVCRALWVVLQHDSLSEIYNISSADEVSVLQLQEKLSSIIRPGENPSDFRNFVKDRSINDQRCCTDGSKLQNLGWRQLVPLEEGLKDTTEWYMKNMDHWRQSKLKWLVYGHSGWIGQKYCDFIANMGGDVYRADSRADDPDKVGQELDSVNPERVVSIVGRTHGPGCNTIDWLEEPGRLVDNIRDNLFAPLVLAEETRKRGIHLTYLGSGCIFAGEAGIVRFSEESLPNFFGSSYSVVKGFTDRLMKQFEGNVLACRIRMPVSFDSSPRNLIVKLTQYSQINSVSNSMTVMEDILPHMIELAKNKKTGTFNMTNPGVISHNEILEMYRETVDDQFSWKNCDEQELLRSAIKSRRSNNELTTSKLEGECPTVLPIKEAVRQSLLNMAKNKNSTS